jgi:hypothetical protein
MLASKATARFMRCDFFSTPKFKLWVVGNHKPRLDNVDEAMRRRMLLVPFLVQIPVEERGPDLTDKLKAEWPAILRWMLEGCLEWQRNGLAAPTVVTAATEEYFADRIDEAVARRVYRRRRAIRLHANQPALCLMESMARRAQPAPRQRERIVRCPRGSGFTRKRESALHDYRRGPAGRHRGLHREGIGPKRTDDIFGQACRIAFASLRQTEDFFSDRCRHGSLAVSDI